MRQVMMCDVKRQSSFYLVYIQQALFEKAKYGLVSA